ncbi:MAG: class A beta-lactamase-related serine hydrolase [Candidatus Omnitrophica bacterium]|nr:class A beta-lactamase-related serine hydrolase [Candidatus Omnitrophota bacterium]
MKNKKVFILMLFILLFIAVSSSYQYYQAYKETQRKRILFEKRKTEWMTLKEAVAAQVAKFKGETGILIKDLDMNWEMSFNKDKLFPSASLVKIPIMVSCFYAIQEGKLKADTLVKLKLTDKVSGSGILKDMYIGKEFSIEDLIEFMIADSDNTATNILINQLGFNYLNASFKSLGLKNTNLSRKMLDFQSRSLGIENYTTAEDIADILEKIYRKEVLNRKVSDQCIRLLKQQKINDRIPSYLPVETTVAHKTGLERFICHDAGIVYTKKGNFLVCVLTKHSEINSKTAKEFIAKIALAVYQYFEKL